MAGHVLTYVVLLAAMAFLAIDGARLVRDHINTVLTRRRYRRSRRAYFRTLRERERP